MDIGQAEVIELPEEETRRRLNETTSEWPIMHAVLKGISRDQMMARHKANHLNVVYVNDPESARECLLAKAELAKRLNIEVFICGK